MTETEKSLKLKRRGAKARFTRFGNALEFLVQESRPHDEITKAEKDYEQAYTDLQVKHEALTEIIEDDAVFEEEEKYIDECQRVFLRLKVRVKDLVGETAAASHDQPTDAENPSPVDTYSSQVQRPVMRAESSCFKMERPKLPKFSGDIREYHAFKADFQHVVHRQYEGRDALMILRSCLIGKPLQNIQGLGHDYEAAWRQLDLHYGDPRMVADVVVNDISKMKPLKPEEDDRFCSFVNLIRRSFNSLNEIGRANDMNNNHMLALIERKMCIDDRRMWFRSQEEGRLPTMDSLLQWMEIELKARLGSSAPVDARASGAVNEISTTPARTEYQCWMCKSNDGHWTDQCKKFVSKSQEERVQLVKDNYACFSCLKKASQEHRMSTCNRKRRCTETIDGDQLVESMLPILIGEAIGQDDVKKRCNVLLDSGSQISLVKQSFANDLQLQGKRTSISITKLGGAAEELETCMYKVPVKALGKKGKVHMVSAIGLPCINDDIAEVKIDAIAQQFTLKKKDLRRGSGPVDLLIGVDHNKFHGGETREGERYTARCYPLGWVVFGSSPNQIASSGRVFHVQLIKPVDMSSFGSTETMGVRGGSCKCSSAGMTKPASRDLTDNEWQAERKLQCFEKRLLKNPEHSRAYQTQMTRMVEMGFARNLTEKEIECKGPVHHILHHAVVRPEQKSTHAVRFDFNSSSKFQGHGLNDYWYKGLELLISLFGVLMRFWENLIAVASTMAQIALRQTAEEAENMQPQAACVLKENTYMDDICISVQTEDEARKLTREVDEVLAEGGFGVNGWMSNRPLKENDNTLCTDEINLLKTLSEKKVLGIARNQEKGSFTTNKVNLDGRRDNATLTKREFLSNTARLFDPIGFAAAFLLRTKTRMQRLWQLGLGWDEVLPHDEKMKWVSFFKETKNLRHRSEFGVSSEASRKSWTRDVMYELTLL
ncbi:uncharacterized protein LOC105438616 [Strongylocentrotus purpuratus]|uniref:Peptidase aspartic putative domain-containing protein n=1 Tax=Strongylocentrotus purpuratus TaxID=7668 RepID=A0A7M7P6Y0_STRPU|nr:uncharacterized protein LOC105438616 [Strongylocentrotus purpuratus]